MQASNMETVFNIFKITNEHDSSEPEFEDYFELNENFTHVTNLIRLQYFAYLKRIIHQNYTEWKKKQSEDKVRIIADEYLEKCAAYFEERAVRYCMVVQLYRKYMLRIISEIRRETTCCELISKLKQCPNSKFEPKNEDVRLTGIKNETLKCSGKFPKVAYKRKLQNEESIVLKTNRLTNGEFCRQESVCEDQAKENAVNIPLNSNQFNGNAEQHIENADENSGENSQTRVASSSNDSCSIAGHSLATNPIVLVPYEIDDQCSDQSNELHNSPETLDDAYSSPKPVEAPYESLSLQEKIQKFEESLSAQTKEVHEIPKETIPKRKREFIPYHGKLSISQPLSPISTSSGEEDSLLDEQETTNLDDSIAKDLESLFAEENKIDDIEDIFGGESYNPEIQLILREIESSKVPGSEENMKRKSSGEPKVQSRSNRSGDSRGKRKRYRLQPLVCDLRQSLWPCELHMWKQRLRETLGQLVEIDIRCYEQVRERFHHLFGEDSEDEFAPYSPSVELDEILVSSCMKRIAPIIVKYLMRPMKEGLIANRFLFKKLAKRFAHNIVLSDQYADEEFIKEQVDLFFCAGRRVESILDIERI